MQAFARGDVQVLVATTVVEVGVDVPNATVMIVENAERSACPSCTSCAGAVGRGSAKATAYWSATPRVIPPASGC